MEGKITKGTNDFEFLQDLFKCWQKVYIPEDTTEYWCELLSETKKCRLKYEGTDLEDFAIQGFTAIVNLMDKRCRYGKTERKI